MSCWENALFSPHTQVHADMCEMAAEVPVSSPDEAEPRHTGDIGMGDEGRMRWLHGLPRPWWRQCRNMRASGG